MQNKFCPGCCVVLAALPISSGCLTWKLYRLLDDRNGAETNSPGSVGSMICRTWTDIDIIAKLVKRAKCCLMKKCEPCVVIIGWIWNSEGFTTGAVCRFVQDSCHVPSMFH